MTETPAEEHESVKLIRMGFRLTPAEEEPVEQEAPGGESPQLNYRPAPRDICVRFTTDLQLLWVYMNEIGSVARATTFTNMASALALLADIMDTAKAEVSGSKPLGNVEFRFELESAGSGTEEIRLAEKVYKIRHITTLRDYERFHNAAQRILSETALQQMVNAYERLIGDLLRWYLLSNPNAASKDQRIAYRELLEFPSMEEAKNSVIDKEVTAFVRDKDTIQQLKYFSDQCGADVRSHFPRMNEFQEVVLRRHAVVHAGGIATPEYVRRLRRISDLPFDPPEEGRILQIDQRYLQTAWTLVYALGVIVLHLVARHCARFNRLSEDEEAADQFLNYSAYTAIKETRLDAARIVLEYGHNLRLATDTLDRMITINLAQTLQWQNESDACQSLLASHDWDAANNLFRLCVAALQSPEDFKEILPMVAQEGSLSLDELYEWPVFQKVREEAGFPRWVEAAFGTIETPALREFPPSVLNFGHETTMKEVLEYLKSRSASRTGPGPDSACRDKDA